MAEGSFLGQVKRLIVGAPIPSRDAHHERLSRVTGLAILSSDALSSVAYATEEILRVLLIGGVAALSLVTPHAWFLRGLGELAGGGGVVSTLPAAGVLTLFGLVTGGLALLGLRREVQS